MQYKRVTYFLFAFLALSCAKEQEAHVVPVVTEGIPLVAQVPQPLETKSAITDDTGIFTWTAGDELAVYAAHPSFGARYYTATLPPAEVGKTTPEKGPIMPCILPSLPTMPTTPPLTFASPFPATTK